MINPGRAADVLARNSQRVASGCIEWMGLKDRDGYGRTWFAGKAIQAHRLAYEVFVGQIPADKELDHTCRNRSCVNASHLEPVSHRENIARAVERRTSCRNGHPWTADNTYVRPDRNARECRACNRACVDRYVARARSAEVRLP